MRTTLVYLTLGLVLMGCKIQRTLETSTLPNEEEMGGRGIRSSVASSNASNSCSITKVSVDGPESRALNDTFVWSYTWTGVCPGASVLHEQNLIGYLDGKPVQRDMAYGAYRALEIGFLAPAGHLYDFVRKCNGPDAYNGGFAFDLGTQTAKLPEARLASTT